MNEYQDQVDKILQAYVRRRMHGGDPPGAEEMWRRFQRTRQRVRRRRFVKVIAVAAVAACLVIGSLALAFPQELRALGERISSVRIVLQGNQGSIRQTQVHDPARSAPDELQDSSYLSAEELKKELPSFPLMGPRYVPEGYVFRGYSLTMLGKQNQQITSHYENDGRFLTITQEPVLDYAETQWFDTDDTKVSDVTVQGVPGKLLLRQKDGWAKVIWSKGNIRYEVAASIPDEEILKVAGSMQPL
ncbi:MAG: DUF4367 domain-containing protein [Bacillota bacterium]|nr:DUF4367 domain-containing protein [Bacillota bacterium]